MNKQKKSGVILLAILGLGFVMPSAEVLNGIPLAQAATTKANTASSFGTKAERQAKLNKSLLATQTADTKAFKERYIQVLKAKGVNTDNISTEELNKQQVTVFVQLNEAAAIKTVGAPTLKQRKDKKHIHAIHNAVEKVIDQQAGVKTQVKKITGKADSKSYGYLYNGFTTKANLSEVAQINKLSDVKSVSIGKTFHTDDSDANAMANVKQVWENESHPTKGEKMVVAIIDSGIDVAHKDLKLSKDTTPALDKAAVDAAISGDADNAGLGHGGYATQKVPYAYNYADHNDDVADNGLSHYHGMHVAGIVAANGTKPDNVSSVVGVAPEAQLLDMKIFSNKIDDGASSEDIMTAIEDSVKLGADVLNMSIGSDFAAESNDPEQIAIKEAAKQGVLSVIAAGNAGNYDDQDRSTLGSPGVVKEALTVASVNKATQTISSGLQIIKPADNNAEIVNLPQSNDAQQFAYSAQALPTNGTILNGFDKTEIVQLPERSVETAPNMVGKVDTYFLGGGKLESYAGLDVAGKIVAMRYVSPNSTGGNLNDGSGNKAKNDIDLKEIIANAKKMGVKGILFYGTATVVPIDDFASDQLAAGGLGKSDTETVAMNQIGLPAIRLDNSAWQKVRAVINADPHAQLSFNFGTTQEPGIDNDKYGTHGQVSLFSSWGPTANLEFKPEIAAPGGNIYSLKNGNTYQLMSGTSMATPFVAGSEALILQNIKNSTNVPTGLDLINLAKVAATNTATPILDIDGKTPVSPRRQGNGEIDVNAAIENKTYLQDAADEDGVFALKQIKNGQATFKAKVTNLDTKQHAYAYNDYGGVYTEDAAFEQDYIQGIINSGAMPDRVEQPNDALIPGAKVTASTQTVTVAAGESKTIEFTLSLPQTATQEFVEGFVALKALDGAHDLIAPYMGYAGDFGKGSQTVSSAEFGTLAFLDGAEKVHTPNENGVIAFSPANPASNFRQAGLYATSNHSIDECSVSIEDADHKHVIDVDKSYYLRKGDIPFAAWNGQTYNQATGKYTRAKDGNYHYVVKTKTLFQTEPEVRDVDLTIDSVAPTVSNTQVIQMPRDKDTALAQELLAAGKIQDTGVFVAGQINDAVGFDSVVNLVIETEEFSSTRQLGKGKGNNFVIQLRNGEDTLIEGTQGKQNIAVGVTDSAGNYGEEVTTFQSGSGVNFYNAKDNAMTPLVADTPGYNATTNKLTLYGSYTPQNTGDELYVDNQKITVDVDAEFAITVDAPALGAKRKVYLTNTPYTDEADALNKAIGYTELYTVDYQLATTLDVDQKFTTSDTLISSKRGTIPAKKIEGTVYDPSIRVTGHSTDANWTDLDNSLTQNNFTRQFNTADFKADVPLYDGLNMIVATANNTYADLGLMVQKYGIYAVHAKSEPVQFDKLKTNVTNQYNAVTAPAAGYDQATGEFTITGITNDLDLEDFIIFGHSNDANDPANQVTVNRNGTFTYKFAIDQDATKTLRYRYTLGTETFNRDLKINLSQSLPVLNFDNTDKWVETANGYEVWTNQDQFTVSGTAQTTKDILEIDINDAIVARKEYLYNGDRNEVVKYTKTIDLEKAADGTAKDTIVKIAYADYKADGHAENGNVANKTITVHRLKTTLAQPSVKQVADKCGKVTLNATAPVDTTVQWSVDGKTWNAYNEQAGVSTNANTTIQFKAVDKYGNSSAIVKYVVNNAQPITIAKPTLCTQKLTKTTATLLFNIGKQTKPMQQLKLEISLNNGKTWQTQNAAQPVVLHKTQIISARVKAQNGATSAVATWYVQLGQHPKVTNLK